MTTNDRNSNANQGPLDLCALAARRARGVIGRLFLAALAVVFFCGPLAGQAAAQVNDRDDGATRDQLILDDLIIDGSTCIGFDCVDGEVFGDDTLRLKENNLRIRFQDTSGSFSFASNDWAIVANDSWNGGRNYLGFADIDGFVAGACVAYGVACAHDSQCGFCINSVYAVDGTTPLPPGAIGCVDDTVCSTGIYLNGTCDLSDTCGGADDATILRVMAGAPGDSLLVKSTGAVSALVGIETAGDLSVDGNIFVVGTVDGRSVGTDGAALDSHLSDLSNPHQVTAVQLGVTSGGETKAGVVVAASFSGKPLTVDVVFATPIATPYSVVVTPGGGKARMLPIWVSGKTAGGFSLVAPRKLRGAGEVNWIALPVGE